MQGQSPHVATGAPPVVLVHGFGGSFEATWQRSGFALLLEEAGRQVIGVDLLGHGTAPRPHDPDAYRDLTRRVIDAVDAIGDGPVDAVGFSLGAMTLLRLAAHRPDRFRRIVLGGIGANVVESRPSHSAAIIAAVEGNAGETDVVARHFARYAHEDGNDPEALVALLRSSQGPITREDLANVTSEVLVAIGDRDLAGPGDPLVAALPSGHLRVLRDTDHFATPESFGFIDAALQFLDAVPD